MRMFLALALILGVGSLAFATASFAGDNCTSCKKSKTVQTAAEGETYVCPTTGKVMTRAGGESHGETCPIAAALEDTELTEHGQAVLTLGKAGKPVWIKEAGFGLIDGKMVECPVHFSTHMTHYVAAQGAEAGCAKCKAVIETAPEKESCDKGCDKKAA